MSRLEEILSVVEHIPPFPKSTMRVMAMLKEPNATARSLAEVIQYDQATTANVLKICNAAYFGLPRRVSSLDEALVVIGHDTLKDIILTSSSARYFKGEAGIGYQLEEGELWRHSVATAIMAKKLVRHIKGVDGSVAFTAGLLHDIGKRFLSSYVADEFKQIMIMVHKEGASWVQAEKKYLGTEHAQLAGLILQKWNFSPAMVQAVRQHHDPEALRKEPLTALIALSNILVVSIGIGVGASGLATELRGEALKRFGITQPMLDLLLADLMLEMGRAEEMLQI